MAKRKSTKKSKNTRTVISSKVTIPISPAANRAQFLAGLAGQLAACQMVCYAQTGFDYNEDVLFDWALTRARQLLRDSEARCEKESKA